MSKDEVDRTKQVTHAHFVECELPFHGHGHAHDGPDEVAPIEAAHADVTQDPTVASTRQSAEVADTEQGDHKEEGAAGDKPENALVRGLLVVAVDGESDINGVLSPPGVSNPTARH